MLPTVLELVGVLLVATGTFLFSVPLGFVVLGLGLLLFGLAAERDTERGA